MSKEREALKLALEFIKANTYGGDDVAQLMDSIREALAEPDYKALYEKAAQQYNELAELMDKQPASKPLTDEQIEQCMKQAYATVQGLNLERAFVRAIEAAHGITGETK